MATFTIGATTATFTATINGSSQEAGDLERVTVTALVADTTNWGSLFSLVTTKYHVHVPLGGNVVVDIARGPGTGTLVIAGLGTATAILVELRRTQYLPGGKTLAQATFLLTVGFV